MVNRLVYIADVRLPTDKAHGIQIMKMCEAFAQLGMQAHLWVPRRHTPIEIDAFAYYGVTRNFSITYLWCADLTRFGKLGFLVQSTTFWAATVFKSLFERETVFYTRSAVVALLLRILGKNVAFEAHMGHRSFVVQRLIALNVKIIVISNGLKHFFISLGAKESQTHVAPDAVDSKQFSSTVLKVEAREKLSLAQDRKIILYTGHLYAWKGAETLAKSAQYLPSDIQIVFIGGTQKDVADFTSRFSSENILFLGKKPHSEIPLYLHSADILVIPNSAKEDISRLYTSPMKLFEYMASKVPIVASNLPSLRVIVSNEMVTFFEPDSPQDLANSIVKTLDGGEEVQRKAQNAYKKMGEYSWENRARNILSFLKIS